MKASKLYLHLANELMSKAENERRQVASEGRSAEWNKRKYDEIEAKYRAEARAIANQMIEAAQAEAEDLHKQARLLRNRPSSPLKPVKGDLMLYHQNRMTNVLDGLNPEECIKEYEYFASTLTDDEKPFLHIYEDCLMAKMKEPSYKLAAEEVAWKYKTVKEKLAFSEARKADEALEKAQTIAAIIQHDASRVAKGEIKPPTYDYSQVFDEMGTYQAPDVTEVNVNPYDGDSE
jgi:hypothetical protein